MNDAKLSDTGWFVILHGPADGVVQQQRSQPRKIIEQAALAQASLFLFRAGALARALRKLERAGEPWCTLADALRAEDHLRRHRLDEALPVFTRLARGDDALGAWAALKQAETLERRGDSSGARRCLVDARASIAHEPPLLRAMVEARLAFRDGRVERAARILEDVADQAEHAPLSLIGAFHRARAIYLSLLGAAPRSLLHHQISLDGLNRLGDRFMLAKEYLSLGQTYLEIGELDHAEFFFRKAEETIEELDHLPLSALLASRQGLLALVRGDLVAAQEGFERDLELSIESGFRHGQAFARRNLGKVATRMGDADRAMVLLSQAREDFADLADHVNQELTRLEEASALLAGPGEEEADAIRQKLDQVGGYFHRIDRPAMRAQVLAVRAQLHVEEGLTSLARETMEHAGQAFQQQRRPDRLVDALLAFSRTLLRKGRERDAIHYLRWAHREAVRAGRPWLARTVIEHLGEISERAVMDLVGPPAVIVDRSEKDAVVRAAHGLESSRSPAMQDVISAAAAVAPTDETVLIQGATGTGKEVVARYVHLESRRASGKFLACNCGALTATLLESEFFGHEAGAFTDAKEDRLGLFEAAAGGTVFLDEVGELSKQGQVTLLRFLQDHAVRPVGSHKPRPVNVRIIAATNRDLRAEVTAGRFREDLYYRLAVYEVTVPPLRERTEDLPGLCAQLLSNIAQAQGKGVKAIGEPVMRKLRAHTWPGNVRELDNVLRYAAIRCKGSRVLKRDLPPAMDLAPLSSESFPTLTEVEREHIQRALDLCNGNKKKAAELLGIHRNTLANKLKND